MTAPDPGLTDLLAAHEGGYDAMDDPICKCGWYGDSHPAHVALVVEQHTNGRIAELEATVARVEALVERAERHGNDLECADIRAALEGVSDADTTREP